MRFHMAVTGKRAAKHECTIAGNYNTIESAASAGHSTGPKFAVEFHFFLKPNLTALIQHCSTSCRHVRWLLRSIGYGKQNFRT